MVNVVDLSIRYKTVHQVNVIQFTQVDGPVVHQMDGADVHLTIVHVVVALITTLVQTSKQTIRQSAILQSVRLFIHSTQLTFAVKMFGTGHNSA